MLSLSHVTAIKITELSRNDWECTEFNNIKLTISLRAHPLLHYCVQNINHCFSEGY
jgi:hypothetical protein